MLVGTKEIKKVAEARMRKKKRAANTLKAAKKSANMMAENSEMSEKQKLKVFKTTAPELIRSPQRTKKSSERLICVEALFQFF